MMRIKPNTFIKTILSLTIICFFVACENKQEIDVSFKDSSGNVIYNVADLEIRVNGNTSIYSVLENNDFLLSEKYNVGEPLSIELISPQLNYYKYKFIKVNKLNNQVNFKLKVNTPDAVHYALIRGLKEVRMSDQSLFNYVIHNNGNAKLRVNNITLSGDNPSQFNFIHNKGLPVSILPNDSLEIQLSFKPVQNGVQNARMVIESNAYNVPSFVVDLYGEGKITIKKAILILSNNGITIKSRFIDFGRVDIESWKDIPLKIDNKGNATLHASVSLNSPDNIFAIEDQLEVTNINLSPGSSAILNIRFNPLQIKSYKQVLNIKSNDKNERLQLRGTGIPVIHEKLETIIKRGKEFFDAGNYSKSIEEFTEVIRRDPSRADAYYFRGYVYYKIGDYGNAKNDFDKVLTYKDHIELDNRKEIICQSLFYAAYCTTQYFYNYGNRVFKEDAIGRWNDYLEYGGCDFQKIEADKWLNKLTQVDR